MLINLATARRFPVPAENVKNTFRIIFSFYFQIITYQIWIDLTSGYAVMWSGKN